MSRVRSPVMLEVVVALLFRVGFFAGLEAGGVRELCVPNRPKFMMLEGVTGKIGCSFVSVCVSPTGV